MIDYPSDWPAGRARFYCDIIECTNADNIQAAMMNWSARGGTFVSCTYIEKSNSFLMIWSSS